MKLSQYNESNKTEWEKAGFLLPKYDRSQITKNMKEAPEWIHFGAGNIFRAFPANVLQNMLNKGKYDKGIIVAEGFDYEIVEKMYQPNQNLSVLVTLKADGTIEKNVVGSIVESLVVNPQQSSDWKRLTEIFEAPSLQMVSFTITEKGYQLKNAKGEYFPDVKDDFLAGINNPKSYIGKVAALLAKRYAAGKYPIAMVSMDNCSHNGTKLQQAVEAFAVAWSENGLVEKGFVDYIKNPKQVSFPWSMIDKITPRPDEGVKQMLKNDGFEDVEAIVTGKNTYVAAFVNAEEPQYLVIQDSFPNGRPKLEEGGIYFTDKETVDKVEKMKVCTCLNPLHTALAVFGCLLDYQLISEEMKNPYLRKLVERIGYEEGIPVAVDPGILEPKAFINEVLQKRLPNPFMPDSPQRIATDTSQKLAIRFGETIKAYEESEDLQVKDLKLIPLVLAAWCRYLMAVDDNEVSFEPSSDPLLKECQLHVMNIHLGDQRDFHTELQPILSNAAIFGVDLYEVNLGNIVEQYFAEMVQSKGAVYKTLQKYVEQS